MNSYIMIICAASALCMVVFSLTGLKFIHDKYIKKVLFILLAFSGMRYITLIVYSQSVSFELLSRLKIFYYASSIGLTMTVLIAVFYVTPFLREKINPALVPVLFLPWCIFYMYIIIMQPTIIVKGSQFGYRLILTGKFPLFLSIAQGTISGIIIVLSLYGIIKYKHLQIRTQLFFIIAAQLLLILDGMSYFYTRAKIIPVFTLTEAFGFASVLYGFSTSVKTINRNN